MDLKTQGPNKSLFCKKWVGALHFRENGFAITFTWPNEPKFMYICKKEKKKKKKWTYDSKFENKNYSNIQVIQLPERHFHGTTFS